MSFRIGDELNKLIDKQSLMAWESIHRLRFLNLLTKSQYRVAISRFQKKYNKDYSHISYDFNECLSIPMGTYSEGIEIKKRINLLDAITTTT